ncbi:MAG: hypothetical protein IKI15_09485 [Lachnospiraceae bacterium]|nr:hypothetical protein [Lachnospiraceae bacterium]
MGHYNNFKTVVYIPAEVAEKFTQEKLASDWEWIEKYIGLDKVYLETHRSHVDVKPEQLRMIKDFLESKDVTVSGGITTTINDFEGTEPGKQRLFGTFCYTDPAMRARLKEISEYTAGMFDEIILDDFYFTNCTCERCIREKGERDWVTFRRELMKDVSENLVVGPAKAVNPKVRMIIKYPNWRESYHFTGYVPEVQRDIFDATYTGTETRSPQYTDQHLPEYLSYSLVRYMENAWPGRNGGGWFDTYACWSIDRYLEQAYLTAFAQAKELMHFQWSDLVENPMLSAMALQLSKIDKLMDGIGKACGVSVYIPFASSGENHLEMRFGMLGLPMEPTPFFPEGAGETEVSASAGSGAFRAVGGYTQEAATAEQAANTNGLRSILLTESSLADGDIVEKLEKYVREGGNAVITTGFFRGAEEKLRAAGLTEARLSGRSIPVTRYQVTGDFAGFIEHRKTLFFPEIVHGNNDSWSLLNGGDGDTHSALVLRRAYGKGRLYIAAIPDGDSGLYEMPKAAVDVIKRVLTGGEYVSGRNVSAFTYDSGRILLYRYVKSDLRPERVTLCTGRKNAVLVDDLTGMKYPSQEVKRFEDFRPSSGTAAEVLLQPGKFTKVHWEVQE